MTAHSYEALVAAGAPILPEGYFYRVKHPSGIGTVTVQLRRRRALGSKVVQDMTQWLPLRYHPGPTAACFLARMCAVVYGRHSWEESHGARFDRELRELVGDHP